MKKVYAYAIRKNNKYELCSQELFDKTVVTTKDYKIVFKKNSKKLWEYFHKQLKAIKKDFNSEEFYINGKLTEVVYGSGLTADSLNDLGDIIGMVSGSSTKNKPKQTKTTTCTVETTTNNMNYIEVSDL